MAVKAIFWDNDGVLVDTERLYFEANRVVLAEEQFELTAELFRKHWLLDSQGVLAIGNITGWTMEKIAAIREKRDSLYSQLLITQELLIPGVEETLSKIPKFVLQAIVTSSRKDHFNLIHARTNVLPYMHFVLAEGDYHRSKPAPDPYLLALKRSGCSPSECLVVEDSERGLRAAKAAGLKCWIIQTELTKGHTFSDADRVIDDVSEVLLSFV